MWWLTGKHWHPSSEFLWAVKSIRGSYCQSVREMSDTVKLSGSNSIWFVFCLNISASEWTTLSPFLFRASQPSRLSIRVDIWILMPFLDQMCFSTVERIFPKSKTTKLFFTRTVRVAKNNSIWFDCQDVNSIKFVRKDLVSMWCQKIQDKTTTPHVWCFEFSFQLQFWKLRINQIKIKSHFNCVKLS